MSPRLRRHRLPDEVLVGMAHGSPPPCVPVDDVADHSKHPSRQQAWSGQSLPARSTDDRDPSCLPHDLGSMPVGAALSPRSLIRMRPQFNSSQAHEMALTSTDAGHCLFVPFGDGVASGLLGRVLGGGASGFSGRRLGWSVVGASPGRDGGSLGDGATVSRGCWSLGSGGAMDVPADQSAGVVQRIGPGTVRRARRRRPTGEPPRSRIICRPAEWDG
jgi:hypothetical protein